MVAPVSGPEEYGEHAQGREVEVDGDRLTGVALFADRPNANGIVFPRAEVERIAAQLTEQATTGHGFVVVLPGLVPGSSPIRLADVGAQITDVKLDDQGRLSISAKVLDTPPGRVVKQMIAVEAAVGGAQGAGPYRGKVQRLAFSISGRGTARDDNMVQDAAVDAVALIDRKTLG